MRQTWLAVFPPLRAAVRRYYRLYNGAADGLTTCLVWGDKTYWFEVALLFEQPEMILGIPIDVVHGENDLVDGLFGTYPAPERYYLELPDIFAGSSFDMINFCMGRDRGCPPYFIFARKASITIQDKGWWAYLQPFSKPVARDEVDVNAYLAEKKRNQKKRPNPGADEGGEMGDGTGRRAKKTAQNRVDQTTDLGANAEKLWRNRNDLAKR